MIFNKRNSIIFSSVILISLAMISTAYIKEDVQITDDALPGTTPTAVETPEAESIYVLGNTEINHILHQVEDSIIIPLSEVTEYEVKARKDLSLRNGAGSTFHEIGRIPAGATVIREVVFPDNWARVTYEGITGYIDADESSTFTIPVVWKEGSQWANLDRGGVDKTKGVSAIENALIHLTKEYQWGAEGEDDYDKDGDIREGFDCSGLTQWAFHEAGMWIPRTTATGYDKGTQISLEDIQIGDLIYFNPPSSFAPVSHVAMYLGDNMMLHATKAFEMTGISEVYWDRMVSIVRFE